MPGGYIEGRAFTTWQEETLPTVYKGATNFGAYVAWEEDPLRTTAPSLAIRLPDASYGEWAVDAKTLLVLSLVDGRFPGNNIELEPIDFTVKLAFGDGREAALPLRRFGTLYIDEIAFADDTFPLR